MSTKCIDEKVIEGLKEFQTAGGEGFLKQLLMLFVSTVPKRIHVLEKALSDKDAEALENEAHALKGISGNIGAVSMMSASEKIQQFAEDGDFEHAAKIVENLNGQFNRAKQELEILLNAA